MTRTRKLRLLTAVAIAAAVLLLTGWFASEVGEGETFAFDNAMRAWLHSAASPALTQFFLIATRLGSTAVIVSLGVIAAAFLVYKRDRGAAVALLSTIIGGIVINNILKAIYVRVRPEAYFDYPLPASYSFPSGHSFEAFGLYITLAWLTTHNVESLPVKISIWAAAGSVVLLVGLSRVYLGVHYPTDVLAGYFAAAIWSSIVLLLYHSVMKQPSHKGKDLG